MLERPLGDLDLCVVFLDGKEFHDFTLIVAVGVDRQGRKHMLGLWSGATENAEVCGTLLDDLIERGLSKDRSYLFVLDGASFTFFHILHLTSRASVGWRSGETWY